MGNRTSGSPEPHETNNKDCDNEKPKECILLTLCAVTCNANWSLNFCQWHSVGIGRVEPIYTGFMLTVSERQRHFQSLMF